MDSDSLLCGLLQVTSPLWTFLFLIYKVKLLGQIGDFFFTTFFRLHVLKNFCLSSDLHVKDVRF